MEFSPAPYFELEDEFALQQKISALIRKKIIRCAHDVSEGGLFVTLCESGFQNGLGFSVITSNTIRKDACLFGEGQSRVIMTVNLSDVSAFEAMLHDMPYEKIGVVTAGEVVVDGDFWGDISVWKEKYDTAIENYLSKEEAGSALSSI